MGKENAEKCIRTGTDCKVLNAKVKPAKNILSFPVLQNSAGISFNYLFASDFQIGLTL